MEDFFHQIITVTIQNVNEAPPIIDTTNLTGSVSKMLIFQVFRCHSN